jgi:hypothetical protein
MRPMATRTIAGSRSRCKSVKTLPITVRVGISMRRSGLPIDAGSFRMSHFSRCSVATRNEGSCDVSDVPSRSDPVNTGPPSSSQMSPAKRSPSGARAASSRSDTRRVGTLTATDGPRSKYFEWCVVRIMEIHRRQRCLFYLDCSHGSQNYH